jgi:hypothetical protein
VRLTLINREKLQSLGSFLVNEFDNLVARIRAAWAVEHGADGEHTHVHAESVSTGRITFSDISAASVNVEQVNNWEPEGLDTAAIIRLSSDSVTPVYLTGIKVPQDEHGNVIDGRVLVLENVSLGTTFVLESESTFSFPRNRFRTPAQADPALATAPGRLFLLPVSLLILTYNAPLARWVVYSRVTDDNVRFRELAGATTHHNLAFGNLLAMRTLRLAFDDRGGAISGIVSAGVPETTVRRVVNAGQYAFDVLHNNIDSAAANRIVCPSGTRFRVHPRETFELMRTAGAWRIVDRADQWIDVVYASGNFTAAGGSSPTWTVEQADQVTLAYQLDGNRMLVSFDLRETSVSGSPTSLQIAIPVGRFAARTMQNRCALALSAGGLVGNAYASVTAGESVIRIFRNETAGAWADATNTTRVSGQIEFFVGDACADIVETHDDVPAINQEHQDADGVTVPHGDVTAENNHSDSPHADVPGSHGDVTGHGDSTTHDDTAHLDEPHQDSPGEGHVDQSHEDHTDDIFAHEDEHFDHGDGLEEQDDHADHTDQFHEDSPHEDSPEIPHEDAAHDDQPHQDFTDHTDDGSHTDSTVTHSDVQHNDGHADTPHTDTPGIESGHLDVPAINQEHEDVGLSCPTSHADV